ncbi:MAG TPA: alpha/beta hydrolase-fold protein [Bacteroidales bacterium]|nr:alpha/beta hydrolase-fold protein [Bacteroidales bacterium]
MPRKKIKKALLLTLISTLFSFYTWAQPVSESGYFQKGNVLEGMNLSSKILGHDVAYAIYLPPGYQESTQRYPVVYLLHGFSDNETAWIQFGEVSETADRAIANREIPPMIIVMPDAKVTWYVNDVAGKDRYEDMAFREFIPFIDNNYRTRPEKEFRAVAGLSMGGYGSLIWSLHHPDMFTACAAFSAGVFTDKEVEAISDDQYNTWFGEIYRAGNSVNRLTEHWKNNSPVDLMESLPVKQIEQVRFYIDCGDDDFLFKGNSALHTIMRNRNIYHEYRVRNGSHNWHYWRTNIIEGLKFIGDRFHR